VSRRQCESIKSAVSAVRWRISKDFIVNNRKRSKTQQSRRLQRTDVGRYFLHSIQLQYDNGLMGTGHLVFQIVLYTKLVEYRDGPLCTSTYVHQKLKKYINIFYRTMTYYTVAVSTVRSRQRRLICR